MRVDCIAGFGAIQMTEKLNTLLSRLEKVRPLGNGKFEACCPAHQDKKPSLGITLFDTDKIGLKCWAGCSVSEIVAAVGLELSSLMPESVDYKKGAKPPRFNKYELFDRLLHEVLILSQGIRFLHYGNKLESVDIDRINLAENTINNLAIEVMK
jgi:hypothetical protein